MITIEKLIELCDKATPGPWIPLANLTDSNITACRSEIGVSQPPEIQALLGARVYTTKQDYDRVSDNIKFIASSREAVPILLEEVLRLREALVDIRSECTSGINQSDDVIRLCQEVLFQSKKRLP